MKAKYLFIYVISIFVFAFFISPISNSFCLAQNQVSQTDTVPSRNYTVVIDPGHGGTDPGSIGYKTKIHESTLNLKMGLLLKNKLEKAGINVVMTRSTDAGMLEGSGKIWKRKAS